MKSRISFFNATVFRKDITRFYPAWLLYGILVLLSMTSFVFTPTGQHVHSVVYSISTFAGVNLVYAPIVVSLLFGDLFKGRLCNGVHALPLRRETLFFTHVVSGFLFSLVPNCIFLLLIIGNLGQFWYVGLFWLLIVTMSYLCFFGIALFSANCTGSRFAMIAVYAGIVFLPMIVASVYYSLYEPLLFGIAVNPKSFFRFSPVYMAGISPISTRVPFLGGCKILYSTENWLWYTGFLAVGVVLGALGLVLYRKRDLETAGDFLSAPMFRPVVLLFCPICIALVLFGFFGLFGRTFGMVLFFPTLVLGVILTQMLLLRTTRVFTKNTWIISGILAAAVGFTLLLTALDPLRITYKTPRPEEVESVTVSEISNVESGYCDFVNYAESGDISEVIGLHESIIKEQGYLQKAVGEDNNIYTGTDFVMLSQKKVLLCLDYKLKNGLTMHREYWLPVDSSFGANYGKILGSPEYVLSTLDYQNWDSFCQNVEEIQVGSTTITGEELDALLEVLKADFDAGNLNQSSNYHESPHDQSGIEIITQSREFEYLSLWHSDSLTYQWLDENGYFDTEEKAY